MYITSMENLACTHDSRGYNLQSFHENPTTSYNTNRSKFCSLENIEPLQGYSHNTHNILTTGIERNLFREPNSLKADYWYQSSLADSQLFQPSPTGRRQQPSIFQSAQLSCQTHNKNCDYLIENPRGKRIDENKCTKVDDNMSQAVNPTSVMMKDKNERDNVMPGENSVSRHITDTAYYTYAENDAFLNQYPQQEEKHFLCKRDPNIESRKPPVSLPRRTSSISSATSSISNRSNINASKRGPSGSFLRKQQQRNLQPTVNADLPALASSPLFRNDKNLELAHDESNNQSSLQHANEQLMKQNPKTTLPLETTNLSSFFQKHKLEANECHIIEGLNDSINVAYDHSVTNSKANQENDLQIENINCKCMFGDVENKASFLSSKNLKNVAEENLKREPDETSASLSQVKVPKKPFLKKGARNPRTSLPTAPPKKYSYYALTAAKSQGLPNPFKTAQASTFSSTSATSISHNKVTTGTTLMPSSQSTKKIVDHTCEQKQESLVSSNQPIVSMLEESSTRQTAVVRSQCKRDEASLSKENHKAQLSQQDQSQALDAPLKTEWAELSCDEDNQSLPRLLFSSGINNSLFSTQVADGEVSCDNNELSITEKATKSNQKCQYNNSGKQLPSYLEEKSDLRFCQKGDGLFTSKANKTLGNLLQSSTLLLSQASFAEVNKSEKQQTSLGPSKPKVSNKNVLSLDANTVWDKCPELKRKVSKRQKKTFIPSVDMINQLENDSLYERVDFGRWNSKELQTDTEKENLHNDTHSFTKQKDTTMKAKQLGFFAVQAQAKIAAVDEQLTRLKTLQTELDAKSRQLEHDRSQWQETHEQQRLKFAAERESFLIDLEQSRSELEQRELQLESQYDDFKNVAEDRDKLENDNRKLRVSMIQLQKEYCTKEQRYKKLIDRLGNQIYVLEKKNKALTEAVNELEQTSLHLNSRLTQQYKLSERSTKMMRLHSQATKILPHANSRLTRRPATTTSTFPVAKTSPRKAVGGTSIFSSTVTMNTVPFLHPKRKTSTVSPTPLNDQIGVATLRPLSRMISTSSSDKVSARSSTDSSTSSSSDEDDKGEKSYKDVEKWETVNSCVRETPIGNHRSENGGRCEVDYQNNQDLLPFKQNLHDGVSTKIKDATIKGEMSSPMAQTRNKKIAKTGSLKQNIQNVNRMNETALGKKQSRDQESFTRQPCQTNKVVKETFQKDSPTPVVKKNPLPLSEFTDLIQFVLESAWKPFNETLKSLKLADALQIMEPAITKLDGRQELRYRDGHREVTFSNGMRKIICPSGWVFNFFTNGDIRGIDTYGYAYYYYHADTIYNITTPDGRSYNSFPDGQVDCRFPNGKIQVRFPQGLLKQIDSDGTEHIQPVVNE